MDHLPTVSTPYQPVSIPYLGGDEYDGLDFAGYPTRQHWQIEYLLQGDVHKGNLQRDDLQPRTLVEAAQFLQTWLYFGMLHEALILLGDDRPHLRDFVRVGDDSQQEYITTWLLPELLRNLQQQIKQRQDVTEYYERFRSCMNISCGVWRDLMETSTKSIGPRLLGDDILLSIQILGAALDYGITEICRSTELYWTEYTWSVIPRSTWLMERMIEQGWCPSIVGQLSRSGATFLYYASLLGPPRRKDHVKCSLKGKACEASNMDDRKTFVLKHVDETCLCEPLVIQTGDGSKVAMAINRGNIPIIHVIDDGGRLQVDIREYSVLEPIPYTAISHV